LQEMTEALSLLANIRLGHCKLQMYTALSHCPKSTICKR
jgi:hypothetical protein